MKTEECVKCKQGKLKNQGDVRIDQTGFSVKHHLATMYVCDNCGYVEFYYSKERILP